MMISVMWMRVVAHIDENTMDKSVEETKELPSLLPFHLIKPTPDSSPGEERTLQNSLLFSEWLL